MEVGKIYFVDFGGTQILGRYKGDDVCNYFFYDYLHYWAGHESYRSNKPYTVKHGIELIREASAAEKHTLLKFSIEHNTI
jgi:hypothetical protein